MQGIKISVCGLRELQDVRFRGSTHVISIWGGLDATNNASRERVDALYPGAKIHYSFFDDTIETDAAFPPTKLDIERILKFTAGLIKNDRLLVHCAAGVSRSAAIAFSAMCQHMGPGFELEAYVDLRSIRPQANPNPRIVQLADKILKRNGAMIAAISENPFIEDPI